MFVAPRSLALAPALALACNYAPYDDISADDDGVMLTEGTGSEATGGTGGSGEESDGSSGTAPDECADACEDGATVCEDGGLARCGAGERGCLEWLAPEPCPGGQVCEDGACAKNPGFSREASGWKVPFGGRVGEGFAGADGVAGQVGDDVWELLDIDGDGALDLVLTAASYPSGDGFVTRNKGFPLAPFWQVYHGGGADGFRPMPTAWLLPVGVGLFGRGLPATAGEPSDEGDAVWALRDVDGDRRPDLVITATAGKNKGEFHPLGSPGAPRWDVYLNTGEGFAAEPVAWALPPGPDQQDLHHVQGGIGYGDGPTWSTLDLDGDGWSDLVITGRADYPVWVVPGFPDSPHWELYRGSAGGFVEPMTIWMLPPGGGAATGFAGTAAGVFGEARTAGDQAWTLVDLDGDRRLELVITGELADSAVGPVARSGGWAVHRADASGFDLSAETYAVPEVGGGSGDRGFYALRGGLTIAGEADSPYDANGWDTLDLDGDGRLDLVVTNTAQELPGGTYTRHALGGAAPYWDVYLGTASGFAAPERWSTPTGGIAGEGFLWTAGQQSPVPQVAGTALWHTGDHDGDGRAELAVTGLGVPGEGPLWIWQVPGFADETPHWLLYHQQ